MSDTIRKVPSHASHYHYHYQYSYSIRTTLPYPYQWSYLVIAAGLFDRLPRAGPQHTAHAGAEEHEQLAELERAHA